VIPNLEQFHFLLGTIRFQGWNSFLFSRLEQLAWNNCRPELILAAADKTLAVMDRRNLKNGRRGCRGPNLGDVGRRVADQIGPAGVRRWNCVRVKQPLAHLETYIPSARFSPT